MEEQKDSPPKYSPECFHDLMELLTTEIICPLCQQTQIVPNFVTISGGTILHKSCAALFFSTKPSPTKDFNNNPLKHHSFDLNTYINALFKLQLKHTTTYDEDIQNLSPEDVSNPSAIIILITEIPKLALLLPQQVLIECIIKSFGTKPSVFHKLNQPVFANVIKGFTKEQIMKIPLTFILENPIVATLLDPVIASHYISECFFYALNESNDAFVCQIYNSSLCPSIHPDHFLIACQKCPNLAILLLQNYPILNIFQLDEYEKTALQIAHQYAHFDLITHLLPHFISNTEVLNHINVFGDSVLTIALTHPNFSHDLTYNLIANTSNLNVHPTTYDEHTVFSWALEFKHHDIVKLFIKNYYNDNIFLALSHLHPSYILPSIRIILENDYQLSTPAFNWIMEKLIFDKNINLIRVLINNPKFDPNFPYCTFTAFFGLNSDFNPDEDEKKIPEYAAIHHEPIGIVHKRIIDIDQTNFPITLLQFAVMKHAALLVSELMRNKCTNPNIMYNYLPPLTLCCTYYKKVTFKNLIYDSRIDPNVTTELGMTPLMYAVLRENYDAIQLLLTHPHIQPHMQNVNGRTASKLAAYRNLRSIFSHNMYCDHNLTENWKDKFIQQFSNLALHSVLDHRSVVQFLHLVEHPKFNPKLIGYPSLPISINVFDFSDSCDFRDNYLKYISNILASHHVHVKKGSAINHILEVAKKTFDHILIRERIEKRLSRHFGTQQQNNKCTKFNVCKKETCQYSHPLCKHGWPVSQPCCKKYHWD